MALAIHASTLRAKDHPATAEQSTDHVSAGVSNNTRANDSPDEDFRAWLKVLGCMLFFMNIYGFQNSFGLFQAYYKTHFLSAYSIAQISWIGTVQAFCLTVVGLITGPLFDNGYHDILVYASSFLIILGMMMLSLSHHYIEVFLSQGLCLGIGCGILYVPSLALVVKSFAKRRALAVTLATAGANIGGIVYSVAFNSLIVRLDFPWTVRILGFVALGLTLIGIALVRPTRTASTKRRSLIDVQAFLELPYSLFCIGGFLKFMAYYIPFVYIPLFGQIAIGITATSSFQLLVYVNIASVVGRLVAAYWAQRAGVMMPWTVCAIVSGILLLCWMTINNSKAYTLWTIFFGLFSGPLTALPGAVMPYISPPNVLGTRMGMTWALSGVALLIGAPIAGTLTDLSGTNFMGLQIFCGVFMLVGGALQIPLWWLLRAKLAVTSAKTTASVATQTRDRTMMSSRRQTQMPVSYLRYQPSTGAWSLEKEMDIFTRSETSISKTSSNILD